MYLCFPNQEDGGNGAQPQWPVIFQTGVSRTDQPTGCQNGADHQWGQPLFECQNKITVFVGLNPLRS